MSFLELVASPPPGTIPSERSTWGPHKKNATTIYLRDDQVRALKRLAAATGAPEAHFIRSAIDMMLGWEPDTKYAERGRTACRPSYEQRPVRHIRLPDGDDDT